MFRLKSLLFTLLLTASITVSAGDFLVNNVRLGDSSVITSITANYENRKIKVVTNGTAHFTRLDTSVDEPGSVLFQLIVDGEIIGSSDLITWFLINPTNDNVRLLTNGNLEIVVDQPDPEITKFTVSKSDITLGETITITWESTGADYCEASQDFVPNGQLATTSGSREIVENTLGPRDYVIRCFSEGNQGLKLDSSFVSAFVSEAPPTVNAAINSFTASSSTISAGEPITLSWSTTGMESCSGTVDFDLGASTTNMPANSSKTFTENNEGIRSYYLECKDSTGKSYNSSVVNVQVSTGGGGGTAPAIRFFSSSKAQPLVNQSFTLSWDAINVNSCVASGDWSGNKQTSGSVSLAFGITGIKTFNLSCSDVTGATVTDSLNVTVIQETSGTAVQITSFTATPNPVTVGTDVTLTWTSSNAVSCRGMSPGVSGWVDILSTNGSKALRISESGSLVFVLRCYEQNNTSTFIEASVSVATTGSALPPVTTNLSVNSQSSTVITEGDAVTFFWSSSNASSCVTTGVAPFWAGQNLATSGSLVFTPRHDSMAMTYGVECSNSTSINTAWVNVESQLPAQNLDASSCAIPFNFMQNDEWSSVWGGTWPGPISTQKTIGLNQGRNLAVHFNTGVVGSGVGVVTSAPTIGTAGLRTATLTQCPGDFTYGRDANGGKNTVPGMDPDCTETWGVASLLRFEVSDNYVPGNGVCELEPSTDYYLNIRFTSACTNATCWGLMDYTDITPAQ